MTIQDYIERKIKENKHKQNYRVGMELNIPSGRLSHYRTGYTKHPSLEVARHIYKIDEVVIYPYSEEAVKGNEDE